MIVHLQLTFQPLAKQRLSCVISQAEEILAQQDGFLGLQKYHCLQENSVILLLDWESMDDFESSRCSPQWLMIMPEWSALQEEELVTTAMKYCEPF